MRSVFGALTSDTLSDSVERLRSEYFARGDVLKEF
jgi:hypothetical protein